MNGEWEPPPPSSYAKGCSRCCGEQLQTRKSILSSLDRAGMIQPASFIFLSVSDTATCSHSHATCPRWRTNQRDLEPYRRTLALRALGIARELFTIISPPQLPREQAVSGDLEPISLCVLDTLTSLILVLGRRTKIPATQTWLSSETQ